MLVYFWFCYIENYRLGVGQETGKSAWHGYFSCAYDKHLAEKLKEGRANSGLQLRKYVPSWWGGMVVEGSPIHGRWGMRLLAQTSVDWKASVQYLPRTLGALPSCPPSSCLAQSPPETVPPAGDQVFEGGSPWGTLHTHIPFSSILSYCLTLAEHFELSL